MIQIGYEGAGIIDKKYERTVIEIGNEDKLIFNGNCFVGAGTRICVNGNLEFGSNVNITGRSDFICYKNIKIGDDSLISWDCLFMDTDFHKIYSNGKILNEPRSICIGNNVWIGCRTTILKGSAIPNGSVIGAGSVVSKKLEKESSIYVGNPVKQIKENINWGK